MVHLTSGTLRKLQSCICALYSNHDRATLPGHVVRTVSRIISAGVASYAEISREEEKLVYTGVAACRRWEVLDAFVRHMDEHPVLSYLHPRLLKPHRFRDEIERAMRGRFPLLRRAPHYTAARVSDALPHRRFRSLGLYQDFFRRNGADFQLLVSFLPTRNGYSLISFNRDRRDFTEEDRLILDLLAPHVAQATRNAVAFQRARRAFAVLERSRTSLQSYGLTGREAEVLYWVSQGKTNAEAAAILRLAPGTVKVHLERIYRKLGVENRTAASALARGHECTAP